MTIGVRTCDEFGHRWAADVGRTCWRCVYCSAVVDGPTLDLRDPNVRYPQDIVRDAEGRPPRFETVKDPDDWGTDQWRGGVEPSEVE